MPKIPWGQTSLNGERPHLQPCFLHLCLTVKPPPLVSGCGLIWWGREKEAGTRWGVWRSFTMWWWPLSVHKPSYRCIPLAEVWNTAFPVATTPAATLGSSLQSPRILWKRERVPEGTVVFLSFLIFLLFPILLYFPFFFPKEIPAENVSQVGKEGRGNFVFSQYGGS